MTASIVSVLLKASKNSQWEYVFSILENSMPNITYGALKVIANDLMNANEWLLLPDIIKLLKDKYLFDPHPVTKIIIRRVLANKQWQLIPFLLGCADKSYKPSFYQKEMILRGLIHYQKWLLVLRYLNKFSAKDLSQYFEKTNSVDGINESEVNDFIQRFRQLYNKIYKNQNAFFRSSYKWRYLSVAMPASDKVNGIKSIFIHALSKPNSRTAQALAAMRRSEIKKSDLTIHGSEMSAEELNNALINIISRWDFQPRMLMPMKLEQRMSAEELNNVLINIRSLRRNEGYLNSPDEGYLNGPAVNILQADQDEESDEERGDEAYLSSPEL
jgi:hypothetical protein